MHRGETEERPSDVCLGMLPKTRKWNTVINLIASGANVERIAAASADAAKYALDRASHDPGVAHAFWLLTQILQAARRVGFSERLAKLGVHVSSAPTLLEIVTGFTIAVDRRVRESGKRTDLGEMTQFSAAETLSSLAGRAARRPALAAVHDHKRLGYQGIEGVPPGG